MEERSMTHNVVSMVSDPYMVIMLMAGIRLDAVTRG